jgi:hypothetical protein
MTCTIEGQRSPDITEKEIRRRLGACYSRLLELARKHEHSILDDDPRLADATGDDPKADCQDPRCTGTAPSTKTKPEDEEGSVAQSDNLDTQADTL